MGKSQQIRYGVQHQTLSTSWINIKAKAQIIENTITHNLSNVKLCLCAASGNRRLFARTTFESFSSSLENSEEQKFIIMVLRRISSIETYCRKMNSNSLKLEAVKLKSREFVFLWYAKVHIVFSLLWEQNSLWSPFVQRNFHSYRELWISNCKRWISINKIQYY